jgi:thiol-disulfide isomerase/thioredoxin
MKIFKRNLRYFLLAAVGILVVGGKFFATEAATVFPEFSSKTIDGQAVSSAVFAEQKLTMINFWGTFCPPCIKEMPDLGRLGRSMPEGTRLIGIVLDVGDRETLSDAQQIRDETNADFLHILPVADMAPYLNTIAAVPTTIFVDSQGRIVGNPIVGSRSESDYRAALIRLLEDL